MDDTLVFPLMRLALSMSGLGFRWVEQYVKSCNTQNLLPVAVEMGAMIFACFIWD